jgi:peptide deformylase
VQVEEASAAAVRAEEASAVVVRAEEASVRKYCINFHGFVHECLAITYQHYYDHLGTATF